MVLVRCSRRCPDPRSQRRELRQPRRRRRNRRSGRRAGCGARSRTRAPRGSHGSAASCAISCAARSDRRRELQSRNKRPCRRAGVQSRSRRRKRVMLASVRTLLLLVGLVACRPERVVNPHEPAGRPARSEVERDVSQDTTAPTGIVRARDGSQFDLATLWSGKRVVLVFYMGHWCPHCQKQLGDLNAREKDFEALGATIVAVSSDSADDATALRARLGLGFELYVDPSSRRSRSGASKITARTSRARRRSSSSPAARSAIAASATSRPIARRRTRSWRRCARNEHNRAPVTRVANEPTELG